MKSNKDRFREDLQKLIDQGQNLEHSFRFDCSPELKASQKKKLGDEAFAKLMEILPDFSVAYEAWYSEAKAFLKQVLPDRVEDFIQHYEPAKNRKNIDAASYRIRDALQGIQISLGDRVLAKREHALTHFQQQLAIVRAAQRRFDSSLFEIRQLVQADLMDSEIEAADHLLKYKYVRAAGAIAGVVLERHLSQVCTDHNHQVTKKNPTINDFNEVLKTNDIIDVPQWRFVQHLADIRNMCDHNKQPEPTAEQVEGLIAGVRKIMKTVY